MQFIHSAAGFEFGKILSNSPKVLAQLGETSPAASKPLNLGKDAVCESVLGVAWVPSADHFTFDRTWLQEVSRSRTEVSTKRQVLRTVMVVQLDLGFVAHFVVHGKIIMQEIWRSGTNWDEPIAEHLLELWNRWIELYESINEVEAVTEEIRVVAVHRTIEEVVAVERFSSWNRMARTMAYVYRAIKIWKRVLWNNERSSEPQRDELVKAEELLWRQAQASAYPEEVCDLMNNRRVSKRSPLYKLSAVIDEHGVIRIASRIGCAPHVPYTAKYPVVLPRDHRITFLLVDSFHRRFLHANNETTSNQDYEY